MNNESHLISTTKAAEQGNANAQFNLGRYYYKGRTVPDDSVDAYKWLLLAGASGHEQAGVVRGELVMGMTAAQVAAAEARVGTWLKKHKYASQRNNRLVHDVTEMK